MDKEKLIPITFPDGSVKYYSPGVTPYRIAYEISPGMRHNVTSAEVDGEEWGLYQPIFRSCNLKLNSENDG